jgi:dTDP-4-dehydrorhamnose 3,5-epimerase
VKGEASDTSAFIEGVSFKELVTHVDERGFFREILRVTDSCFSEGFGQWSHSRMYAGTAKAWHVHQKQVDWWYVGGGVLKVVLHDLRESSPTFRQTMEFRLGDNQPSRVVRIPPGVAHGCKCISGPADLFYITSRVYDPSDEGRIPHDDQSIGYDWLAGPEIK